MLGWALAFYASYLLLCAGLLPVGLFVPLGAVLVLRFFNRWHEALHANQRGAAAWHPARDLIVLMGPMYLGSRELEELHLLHHRLDGAPGDPDIPMMQPRVLRALGWCLVEPELSAWTYARRFGLSPALLARMLAHAAAWAGLMWLGGWQGLVGYNLAVRIGNGLAWLVFSWVVHQPGLYGQVHPPDFPRPLVWLWIALVGRENYYAVRFHYLHHVFPSVPDRDLPGLSHRLGSGAALPAREAA